MNLEWLKKHKLAAGGAILVGLLVIFFLFRQSGSSSSSGLSSLAANQEQGQLQLAELNAQASSQQSQLNTQLSASEFQTQAQEQESQDQLAAEVASQAIPYQFEAPIYQQELTNQAAEQSALLPLESQLINFSTSGGGRSSFGLEENELLSLFGAGEGTLPNLTASPNPPSSSTGVTLNIPGLGNLGVQNSQGIGGTLGSGLFA